MLHLQREGLDFDGELERAAAFDHELTGVVPSNSATARKRSRDFRYLES